MGTNLAGSYFDFVEDEPIGYGGLEFKICTDFRKPDQNWEYSWGDDFWLKKDDEVKWLVLATCFNLGSFSNEHMNPELSKWRPDKNWAKVVELGYVRSVCGFSDMINSTKGFLRGDHPRMTMYYSTYLNHFITDSQSYSPDDYCYIERSHWDTAALTKDPSIAAWMEAAITTIITDINPTSFIDKTNIDSASAVNAQFKWYIDGIEDFKSSKDPADLYIMMIPLD